MLGFFEAAVIAGRRMKRREFIAGAVLAAVWSLRAHAQQSGAVRRIGVLMGYANDAIAQERVAVFARGLEKLGWVDGKDIRIDYRFAASDPALMRTYASELVASSPDLIFASTPQVVATLKQETKDIPIILVNVADPVGAGLVQSLAASGSNVTGFANFDLSIGGKWLGLLKELKPSLVQAFVLAMPQHVTNAGLYRQIESAAVAMNLYAQQSLVRSATEIEQAIDHASRQANSGLIVLPNPVTTDRHEQIVAMSVRARIPAIFPYRDMARGGGLMSYGPDIADDYLRSAIYADRILKGEKPNNLPIQAPVKYELVINLKTAKAIGLDMPVNLIARADEVLE
jgi:putative ABC transport system substrate-binding protein